MSELASVRRRIARPPHRVWDDGLPLGQRAKARVRPTGASQRATARKPGKAVER